MSENRRQILQMLSEGHINAQEAERLIAALERAPGPAGERAASGTAPKYLRVLIEADEHGGGEVKTKVNIRVPLRLLRAGVKLASLLPPEARDRMNEALNEKGVAFDISRFKVENLDELIENLKDVSIDVANRRGRNATIKVFCE